MKISPKDLKPLVKARKPRTREAKTTFQQGCEDAGLNENTVRRRMMPRDKGGQGMTLEEALKTPVRPRSERAAEARKKSPWSRKP